MSRPEREKLKQYYISAHLKMSRDKTEYILGVILRWPVMKLAPESVYTSPNNRSIA